VTGDGRVVLTIELLTHGTIEAVQQAAERHEDALGVLLGARVIAVSVEEEDVPPGRRRPQ
jgi:hypothetical protein